MQEGKVSTFSFIVAVIDNRKAREFQESFPPAVIGNDSSLGHCHLRRPAGPQVRPIEKDGINVIQVGGQTSSDVTQARHNSIQQMRRVII